MRSVRAMAAVTLLLGSAAVGLVGGPPPAEAAGSAAVSIVNFSFQPPDLTVPAGTTVTWTNNDQTTHTVTSDSGAFDSGSVTPGYGFSHQFGSAGTFTYHCSIHTFMHGTVTVTAGATTTAPAPPTTAPRPTAAPPPPTAAPLTMAPTKTPASSGGPATTAPPAGSTPATTAPAAPEITTVPTVVPSTSAPPVSLAASGASKHASSGSAAGWAIAAIVAVVSLGGGGLLLRTRLAERRG